MQETNRSNSREKSGKNYKRRSFRGKKRGNRRIQAVCPICENQIRDLYSAIEDRDHEGKLVHFDCILSKLQKDRELEKNQRIAYLGNGNFGIIESDPGRKFSFKILERFEMEDKEIKTGVKKKIRIELK